MSKERGVKAGAICVFFRFKQAELIRLDVAVDPLLLRKCTSRSVRKIQQFICLRAETGLLHKVVNSPHTHLSVVGAPSYLRSR